MLGRLGLMLNISFDKIKLKDIPELLRIENMCFSEPWSENTFKNTIGNENTYFICARYESKLLGYIGMYWVLDEGYVYNLAVDKDFRGLKIATNLINELFKYSESIGLKFLSLEVRRSNEIAKCLYQKLGFKLLGVRKNFYTSPLEDAIIMTYYF